MREWIAKLLGDLLAGQKRAADKEGDNSGGNFKVHAKGEAVAASPIVPMPTRRYVGVPSKVLAIDVETTGLSAKDRMVSFAAILLQAASLEESTYSVRFIHLVFDPGFKGSAEAERIHGYNDWYLRHQPFAVDEIENIEMLFAEADTVIAHNAEFDLDFISREFAEAGRLLPAKPVFCTMQGWRSRYPGRRASLNAACRDLGISRRSEKHGALEDAWLALQVYLCLHAHHQPIPMVAEMSTSFANEQPVPPMPEGPLPRRKRRKKGQAAGGR